MDSADMITAISAYAEGVRQRQFYATPYRTGNLAASVGDLGMLGIDQSEGYAIGYKPCDANASAPYGAILNDAQKITVTRRGADGKAAASAYVNKHYRWFDKFYETEANEVQLYLPVRRVF